MPIKKLKEIKLNSVTYRKSKTKEDLKFNICFNYLTSDQMIDIYNKLKVKYPNAVSEYPKGLSYIFNQETNIVT